MFDTHRTQCRNYDVTVQGTSANETFHIYPDRVEIYDRSTLNAKPITIKRTPPPRRRYTQPPSFVIDTGTGNDTSTAHDNVEFAACFRRGKGDGYDRLTKQGGNTRVLFAGNGSFTATAGHNDIYIEGDGTVHAGAGDDDINIEGQATINAGAGDDHIRTGIYDDTIITGPGADRVNAGEGNDNCDATWRNSRNKGDTYEGCETIYGM